MAKENKRQGMICKNEHDTLLAIKVSLLTRVSDESAFSRKVFWIFDNLPNLSNHDFKTKKCDRCKGEECEGFKKLRKIKKMVSDPATMNDAVNELTKLYQIPDEPPL
ncbi:MAG: hypothetical protein HQL95_14360 [Magnetococcales bacterium]|nr:hypothetical protein [Magnetococcales bacterium]